MRILLTLSIFVAINFNFLIAQERLSTPLAPSETLPQQEIGGFIGLGWNFANGTFRVECDTCEFGKADGFGITLGAIYERDINQYFQWGGVGLYDFSTVESHYLHRAERYIIDDRFPEPIKAKMDFEQKAEAQFHYLGIGPFIKWSPSYYFYVRLAAVAGTYAGSHLLHTESLLTPKATLESGEIVDVSQKDNKIEDGPFHDVIAFQFGLLPMVAANIPLSRNVFLAPGLMYYFPLTRTSDFGDNFSIHFFRVTLELRVALRLRRVIID